MKLSIVVPCYNEEKNIKPLLQRFSEVITRTDVEVILVNNGSTDNSQKVIEELLSDYPFVRVVKVEINQGYGYGILQGLNACQGEFVGWTHADLQTDPKDVLRALEIIESGNDKDIYVKGNRKGRPLFDQFFTIGMSLFETLYLGVKLFDINAQPNIFPRTFFERWNKPPYDFSLDLYALYMARKYNLKVVRFDVIFPKRIHGESKWNTGMASKWKFIKRTMDFSYRLKREGIR